MRMKHLNKHSLVDLFVYGIYLTLNLIDKHTEVAALQCTTSIGV